jgi:DMSO/TMAO reductase YedYZ molybdopterin-dependent catalytic subunit
VIETRKLFNIGFIAGGASILLSFSLRIFAGGLFIPELASQTLFSLMPGTVESQAVGTLGPMAKQLTFAVAIVANLFLYGVIGVLSHRVYHRLAQKGKLVSILLLSFLSYLILFSIALIMLEVTQFLSQPLPLSLIALYLFPPHIVFGLIVYFMFQRQDVGQELIQSGTQQESRIDVRRRQFLRLAVVGAIGSALLFYGINILSSKPSKSVERPTSQPVDELEDTILSPILASEVTPNDRFYKVDVNILTPIINSDNWTLNVKGLVNNPLEITYEELKSLSTVEEYATLECISNKIGEDLISTALWKGVLLKTILEKVQVKPEATYIVFKCYDGYDVGIPLERALDGTVLAYEMNGTILPTDHGFPVRAVVPGLYGMMNAKWITEIEVVNRTYEGFWQRQGWRNEAEYQIHSTIMIPGEALASRFGDFVLRSSRFVVGGKVPIAGIAFAGDRGISKVEISTDDGKTWETARIREPLSKNTWVLWSTEWIPPAEGRYRIIVRASDMAGRVQSAQLRNPFPNGSTGYHGVDITVE